MVLTALKEVIVGPPKFTLMDLEGFPYEKYEEQWTQYTIQERWFTGAALADQETDTQKNDLYPMRINPIVGTVLKHAQILFGEPEDDARPLVVPKFVYQSKNEDQKKLAEHAEEVLNMLWYENHGRAILIENAILSQIYGGCVFKGTYVPWEWDKYGGLRTIPIRVERINPKNFIGIPDASDNYNLLEAWILKEIPITEARLWGYEGTEENVWYIEHWKPNEYQILIDGKPATRNVKGEKMPMSGENPWKFVPLVYIPHVRAGDFKGFNAYGHLVGMVKELNARWGDFGDAVNDDSHPIIAARNLQKALQVKRATEWLEYVDLGSNPGIAGNEPEPDLFQVNEQRASTAMDNMVKGIFAQYRRDAFVPPVADGEDEGSQRSGLTLAIRFWPLTSHATIERYFWTPGLNVFHRMLLKMMLIKGLSGISEEHTKLRIKEKWAPFLPRDRDADVNEWAIRASNEIASVEHLIELAADVEDVPEERDKILKWIEDIEDIKAKVAAKYEMKLQEKELASQEKQAETQATAFQNRPAPQGGGGK